MPKFRPESKQSRKDPLLKNIPNYQSKLLKSGKEELNELLCSKFYCETLMSIIPLFGPHIKISSRSFHYAFATQVIRLICGFLYSVEATLRERVTMLEIFGWMRKVKGEVLITGEMDVQRWVIHFPSPLHLHPFPSWVSRPQ